VDFVDSGHRVGMRAKELCTLDNLPDEVLKGLGEKASALSALVNQTSAYVAGGVVPGRMGNAHLSLFPYEPMATGDGELIVIAGNEPFSQGAVDYRGSCREAIGRGIVVNTIFCGPGSEGLRTGWKDGADLADGQYAAIDADNAPPPPSAPQDAEIARLGRELNGTYVAFGRQGAAGKLRQEAQDANAAVAGGAFMAERAAAKAAPVYDSSSWDLVDAKKKGLIRLEELSEDELPREMKGMSAARRREYVASMQKKREEMGRKVAALSAARERFLREQRKSQAGGGGLDDAVIRALRRQAEQKGYVFGK